MFHLYTNERAWMVVGPDTLALIGSDWTLSSSHDSHELAEMAGITHEAGWDAAFDAWHEQEVAYYGGIGAA